MKITVDVELFTRMVECIERLSIIHQEPADVQEQWKKVIVETVEAAHTALLATSVDIPTPRAASSDAQTSHDAAMANATKGNTKDQFM